MLVTAAVRGDDALIPDGDFVLRAGDRLSMIGEENEIRRFLAAAGQNKNRVKSALILGGSGAKTLPAAFTGLVTPHGTFWGQLCAAAFVVTLPIIILAAFLQKYLIRGLSMGAVKG